VVAVLAADTLALQTTIPVGKRVWGITLSRNSSRLYTCNGVDNTVSVVDTAAKKQIAAIAVGSGPWGVIIDD
jgi:YVTN family beta-propeller protein